MSKVEILSEVDVKCSVCTLTFDDGGRGFAGFLTIDYLSENEVIVENRIESKTMSLKSAVKKGNAFIKEVRSLYGEDCILHRKQKSENE